MTNSNITDLVIVQDRSGSMNSIRSDAEGGINSFIQQQKDGHGETFVSFVEFDDHIDTLYLRRRIEFVNPYVLVPRGMTALRDAIGSTIERLGNLYSSLDSESRPGKVYFVVNTDGLENTSKIYSQFKINEMISHQRDKYAWEFVFLAANQDAIATGTSYGFSAGGSMTYTGDNVAVAYASAGEAILTSRVAGGQSLSFTEEQRKRSVK